MDIFSWEPADMIGVSQGIIEHNLNVNTSIEMMCQKRKVLAPEKSNAVARDVGEWVKAGIVRSVKYPTWISNPVLVKKCYMVTSEEIRANPKKTRSLADLQSPRIVKVMQSLAEKLAALNRRLRRYFEAHPVKVITDQPIKQILTKTEPLGKLAKYAVELGAYNIMFEPRNAVKGQVLADFITETPDGESPEEYFRIPKVAPEKDDTEDWTLFMDGASSVKGSGAGLVLIGPSGVEHPYALLLTFDNTNNEAEYEALLAGLRIARGTNIQKLEAKVDSKLVTSQINGNYVANNDSMMKYLAKAKGYIACFKSFSIKNILRNQNQKADVLSKLASVAFNHLTKEVLVKVLNE
ncbi:reverse transcriptase domain-containing protein [Tanacetum coccineum]